MYTNACVYLSQSSIYVSLLALLVDDQIKEILHNLIAPFDTPHSLLAPLAVILF